LDESNPSPSSLGLGVSLYDDYESFLSLKPNFIVNTPLTGLEEVIDPPLTPLPFIAPSLSSTHRDTTEDALSLLSSRLCLAQCKGLEMDDSPGSDVSYVEDDSLDWFGDIELLEPPFEEFYGDDVRVGVAPSIENIDPI